MKRENKRLRAIADAEEDSRIALSSDYVDCLRALRKCKEQLEKERERQTPVDVTGMEMTVPEWYARPSGEQGERQTPIDVTGMEMAVPEWYARPSEGSR